jgi:hypothetical protein
MSKELFCHSPIPVLNKKIMRFIVKHISVCFLSILLVCCSWCFILTSSSCGDKDEPLQTFNYPLSLPVMILLVNESADDVHLWINPCSGFEGETINPGNKLITDEHRSKFINLYWESEGIPVTLSISMGQNGKTLKTASCPVEPATSMFIYPDQYTAKWDGETGKILLYDAMGHKVATSN